MEVPITVQKLLQTYQAGNGVAEKLVFHGVLGKDVYNITAPFSEGNKTFIAGRVESRDSEHSEVMFFAEREKNHWHLVSDAPVFTLQDPFWTTIGNQFVFGGVEIYPHPKNEKQLAWRTILYKGDSIYALEKFFFGPDGMKDLRIKGLLNGDIVVLTRPQREKGGRGKIGYAIISDLAELSIELVENAPLLANFVTEDEWIGGNAIYVLADEKVGVLAHIACFSAGNVRHYYAMSFRLNPYTGEYGDVKIIAQRSDFLAGPAKRPDLVDVVFSGGLVFNDDEATLYAGISDAGAQKILIKNPFH